jgi:protein TonB
MLDVLLSSRPTERRGPLGAVGSLLIHALVLALVVETTRASVDARLAPVADTTLVFLRRLAPPAIRPDNPPPPSAEQNANRPNLVLAENPPPKGFQTVVAPQDLPTTIPPVDLKARPLDPRDFSGRGVEGGVARGIVGGTGKVDPETPAEDVVYTATTQLPSFEPAVLISQPAPKYPPVLQQVGLSGRVVLQFIVDTTGRVESASIHIMESSNEGFEPPAREAVAGAIFHPARLGPRPVRQLARQGVRFIATQ